MASKSALLRNIRPSGGLFTENILLRLRDNPERVNIGKIKSFVEEDSKEQRDQFKDKRRTTFDWCIQKWDEISPKIKDTLKEESLENRITFDWCIQKWDEIPPKIKDTLKEESLEKWSLDDLIQKWLIPFFEQFDYELETFEKNEENIDNDSPLKDFNSSKGKLNKYALFSERSWKLISPYGYLGIINPTGIIMNYNYQEFFKNLVNEKAISSIFDFENKNQLFKIHRQFRFCLLTIGGKSVSQEVIPVRFLTINPSEIQNTLSFIYENKLKLKKKLNQLDDNNQLIPLYKNDFALFNPNTFTCPSLRTKKDADLLRFFYENKRTSILIKRDPISSDIISNPWNINLMTMFNMSSDSNHFRTQKELKRMGAKPLVEKSIGGIWIDEKTKNFLPLYEGKTIWIYDHRYNNSIKGTGTQHAAIPVSLEEHRNHNFFPIPLYWVEKKQIVDKIPNNYNKDWLIAIRAIINIRNERTFISTIIPKTAAGHSLILLLSERPANDLCLLLANFNSLIFDYIVKNKVSGNNLSLFILEQLPLINREFYSLNLKNIIINDIRELIYTSKDLWQFANNINCKGDPFIWDLNRRYQIMANLDAIYAILYNISKKNLIYIINSFDILQANEINKYKEFKTKRLILEAYDKFSKQKELFV